MLCSLIVMFCFQNTRYMLYIDVDHMIKVKVNHAFVKFRISFSDFFEHMAENTGDIGDGYVIDSYSGQKPSDAPTTANEHADKQSENAQNDELRTIFVCHLPRETTDEKLKGMYMEIHR